MVHAKIQIYNQEAAAAEEEKKEEEEKEEEEEEKSKKKKKKKKSLNQLSVSNVKNKSCGHGPYQQL